MSDAHSSQPDGSPRRFTVEETTPAGDPAAQRELVLVKNGQRFVFRCAPGGEAALLRQLGDLVRDPNVDLTWFDAAVLSHQVGQELGKRLQQLRKP